MSAYPASHQSHSHHGHATIKTENMVSFVAAMQALRETRKSMQQESPAMPPTAQNKIAPVATTNFSLQVGVEAGGDPSVHIRAAVISLDSDFKVMSFPAQHESFLWELNLPAGNYRLEIKGNNPLGGLTTADINGNLRCASSHKSSQEERYVMGMNFAIG